MSYLICTYNINFIVYQVKETQLDPQFNMNVMLDTVYLEQQSEHVRKTRCGLEVNLTVKKLYVLCPLHQLMEKSDGEDIGITHI